MKLSGFIAALVLAPLSTWAENRVPITNPVWKGYSAKAIVRELPKRAVDGKLGRSRYRFFVKGKDTYPDGMGRKKTVYFEAKTHAVLRGDRLMLIPRIRIDLEGFMPEYQKQARAKMGKELRALDSLLQTVCLKQKGSGRTITLRLRPRFTTKKSKNLDWEPNSVEDDWRETTTKSLDFGSKPPFGVIAHEGVHVFWGGAEEYPYLSRQFSQKKTLMAGASALAKDGRTPPALLPVGASLPMVLAPHTVVPLARVVEGMLGGKWEPVAVDADRPHRQVPLPPGVEPGVPLGVEPPGPPDPVLQLICPGYDIIIAHSTFGPHSIRQATPESMHTALLQLLR